MYIEGLGNRDRLELKVWSMTEKEQNGGEHCNESAVDETETKANGHLTSDDLIDEEDDSFNACNFACIETVSDTVTSFVQGVFHK